MNTIKKTLTEHEIFMLHLYLERALAVLAVAKIEVPGAVLEDLQKGLALTETD